MNDFERGSPETRSPESGAFRPCPWFLVLFLGLAILSAGCADKREPREFQDHFKGKLKVGKSSIRGGLISFDLTGENSSATIFVRKFEDKAKAVKYVEESIQVTRFPLIERNGQWVIYLENWSNRNFMNDEKFKEEVLDAFWDW